MKNHIAVAFLLLVGCFGDQVLAQGAKVSEVKVSLAGNFLDYRGRCPVEIPVQGVITATGLGLIKYQFVHSSGASGPVQRLLSVGARAYDVRENPPRSMSADAPDWNDTVTLRILSGSGSPFDSIPVKYIGTCGRATAAPKTAYLSLGPAQGNFRVTINGFTCNSPTSDVSILGDGAGDEVYMYTKTFNVQMKPDGSDLDRTTSDFVQSFEYGDIGNGQQHGQRIRAGSSRYIGSNGGIVAGDSYPASPEKHSTDPQFQTLPELVWRGTIARYKNGVIIVPMIWESDGQTGLLGNYQNLELSFANFTFSQMIRNPSRFDLTRLGFAIRADFDTLRPLEHRLAPEDKPMGYREAGGFRFSAQALFLSYDEALRMAEAHRSTGKAFPITYTNDPDAGGGSYTIWVQVEQQPN